MQDNPHKTLLSFNFELQLFNFVFFEQLLEALALQIASEVSFNELARLLNTDIHTVQRYISLLEKAFIIFRLRSFSRKDISGVPLNSRRLIIWRNTTVKLKPMRSNGIL